MQKIRDISNRGKIILLVTLVAIISLIFGITVFISNRSQSQPNVVNVVNFDAIKQKMSQSAYENLSAQLYYLLANHFDVPDSPESIKATLRLDTLKEIEDGDFKSAGVIVDVDDYKQTYQIYISWSSTEDIPVDILIECAEKSLSAYPDEKCYGMYDNSESVQIYLPYEGSLNSGNKYIAEFDYYSENETERVLIKLPNCSDVNDQRNAIEDFGKYLRSIELDPASYEIEAPLWYQDCIIN